MPGKRWMKRLDEEMGAQEDVWNPCHISALYGY
jgi:hypothetical protein